MSENPKKGKLKTQKLENKKLHELEPPKSEVAPKPKEALKPKSYFTFERLKAELGLLDEFVTAFVWTLWTFVVASAPLLILWLIDTMLIVDSNDALRKAINNLINDGLFMFIGLSCAGASFIDAYFSKKYELIGKKPLKFINVSFCFIVAIICIFQATNFALKNLAPEVDIIDMDAFKTASIYFLIVCFIYSIYTKAILIKYDK